jgi:hypothetical protein
MLLKTMKPATSAIQALCKDLVSKQMYFMQWEAHSPAFTKSSVSGKKFRHRPDITPTTLTGVSEVLTS